MIPLTLAEVAAAADGPLLDAPADHIVTGVVIDSRNVQQGRLFAALRGDNVDGALYTGKAISQGAAAVLVPAQHPQQEQWSGMARIPVPDVQVALGQVAKAVRARSRAQVVAITGSNGKTTTKDMLYAVLAPQRTAIANEKSFNNELGVPLTLCRLEENTEIAVVEMGTAGEGQIAELCDIAAPDVAVVTMIGRAHLDQFGSQEAIAKEKGTLPAAVPATGLTVLNADDPRVLAMRANSQAQCITFSRNASAGADVWADGVVLDEEGKPRFQLHTVNGSSDIRLNVIGEHMVVNALAAAATATGLGMTAEQIAEGLAAFRPSSGRMKTHQRSDGILVIDDSYNASPDSAAAALRALAAARKLDGRAIAVLGTVGGMGDQSALAHRELGHLAAAIGIDLLISVGQEARPALTAALDSGLPWGAAVAGPDEAVSVLTSLLRAGDTVLVKASHSAALDRSVAALINEVAA